MNKYNNYENKIHTPVLVNLNDGLTHLFYLQLLLILQAIKSHGVFDLQFFANLYKKKYNHL